VIVSKQFESINPISLASSESSSSAAAESQEQANTQSKLKFKLNQFSQHETQQATN
jgi:hypothetical protein